MCESPCPSVLIESDWNLKFFFHQKNRLASKVLIESDWNLKLHLFHLYRKQDAY